MRERASSARSDVDIVFLGTLWYLRFLCALCREGILYFWGCSSLTEHPRNGSV